MFREWGGGTFSSRTREGFIGGKEICNLMQRPKPKDEATGGKVKGEKKAPT